MTRDEAINILRKKPNWGSAEEITIDAFVALGMLKLDEPKNAMDSFCEELRNRGYRYAFLEKDIAIAMGRSGLKLVEK